MQHSPSLFDTVWERKFAFLFVFFVIFTVTYGVLFALDFLPEPPSAGVVSGSDSVVATSSDATVVAAATPTKPQILRIGSLDREVAVLNPETRDIVALDAELLKGVVRHPDSALLGEDGNVLILGHSSYLPNVLNKNFQALNGIQKLQWGDTIELQSGGVLYTYRVTKVYQAKASGVTIPTEVSGKRLTLVTCNSFGSKEDRFIVEAELLSEKTL